MAKQQEQSQRHTRFIDTDYNLEPNLKESPGGLRDLHTVLWISRACGFGTSWHGLARIGMISSAEARAITRHESLLQTLRIRCIIWRDGAKTGCCLIIRLHLPSR